MKFRNGSSMIGSVVAVAGLFVAGVGGYAAYSKFTGGCGACADSCDTKAVAIEANVLPVADTADGSGCCAGDAKVEKSGCCSEGVIAAEGAGATVILAADVTGAKAECSAEAKAACAESKECCKGKPAAECCKADGKGGCGGAEKAGCHEEKTVATESEKKDCPLECPASKTKG